jgi:hypothetical protein
MPDLMDLDQSVVLVILSLIVGAFMVASLSWRLAEDGKHVATETRADKEEGTSGRGLHKFLVAHLEDSRKNLPRSIFQQSRSIRKMEDLSPDLRDLSELLMINHASTVSVSATPSTLGTDLTVIISLLAQVSNVFVVVSLSDAEASLAHAKTQALIQQQLRAIPAHRILLSKSIAGKVALVRQLSPSLHIDDDHAVTRLLSKHIRSVVLANEGMATAAEREWVAAQDEAEPPNDAVYAMADGVILIDAVPSLLVVDLRAEALARLPRASNL